MPNNLKSYRPYVSLDIEATGLNIEKAQILQIGAIFDNGNELDKLLTFNCIIKYKSFDYFEPTALLMNYKLIKKWNLEKDFYKDIIFTRLNNALSKLNDFLKICYDQTTLYDREHNIKMRDYGCTIAGKNVSSFDIPILKRILKENSEMEYNRFQKLINYRYLDVGSLYVTDFGYVPGLFNVLKYIGKGKEISHDALDDAFDVIYAVRYKFNKKQKTNYIY